MEERKQMSNKLDISVSLLDTLTFAEWVDINCVRSGHHEWTYREDNYKVKRTTEEMYQIYYNEK